MTARRKGEVGRNFPHTPPPPSPSAPLPLLISVPHGGLRVPPEVEPLCRLDLPALLRDGDTWAGHLYAIESWVRALYRFPVARAVVDVNRDPGDVPPENPDGVVKTVTVEGEPVWQDAAGLFREQAEILLERYYYPYQHRLERATRDREILLGLDCHTMLERAPGGSPRPGERRPLVCLSNRGDEQGEALQEPVTAPPALLRTLARALENELADLALETPASPGPAESDKTGRLPGEAGMEGLAAQEKDRTRSGPGSGAEADQDVGPPPLVWLNRPFRGGYIITHHGRIERNSSGRNGSRGGSDSGGSGCGEKAGFAGRLPWIQVEFNRALYLGAAPLTAVPDPDAARRLEDLRRRFLRALETLFREYSFPSGDPR